MLTICQAGAPVLRQQARLLSKEAILSPACQQLIEAMKQTMRAAPGVGLAAPQIGQSLQLAVIEDRPEYIARWSPEQVREFGREPVPFYVIINPQIELEQPENPALFFEGCLSVAGFGALVPRARRVRVKYLDQQARPREILAQGWHARILQHEIDHLGGKLYLDRMLTRSFSTQDNLNQHWSDQEIHEVCRELGIGEKGRGRRRK